MGQPQKNIDPSGLPENKSSSNRAVSRLSLHNDAVGGPGGSFMTVGTTNGASVLMPRSSIHGNSLTDMANLSSLGDRQPLSASTAAPNIHDPDALYPFRFSEKSLVPQLRAIIFNDITPSQAKALDQVQKPSSLVGIPLHLAAMLSDFTLGCVPAPVAICIHYILLNGTQVEGLFRKPGNKKRIDTLLKDISDCFLLKNGGGMQAALQLFQNSQGTYLVTPHDVAGMLMSYLRALPEKLMTERLIPMFINTLSTPLPSAAENGDGDPSGTLTDQIMVLMKLLPNINRVTFYMIVEMCHYISLSADKNLMSAKNLGLCIGTTIALPEILEFIITHRDEILYGELRTRRPKDLTRSMTALHEATTTHSGATSTLGFSRISVSSLGGLSQTVDVSSRLSLLSLGTGTPGSLSSLNIQGYGHPLDPCLPSSTSSKPDRRLKDKDKDKKTSKTSSLKTLFGGSNK